MSNHFPAEHITNLIQSKNLHQHEPFWAERLSSLLPLVLPYTKHDIGAMPSQPDGIHSVSVAIPKAIMALRERNYADWRMSDLLLAAFAAYLARISRVSAFDLGFRDGQLQQAVRGLEDHLEDHLASYAPFVPLRVDMSGAQRFSEVLQAVQEELALIRAHKSYAHDIATRYSLPEFDPEELWPVVVEQVEALWEMYSLNDEGTLPPFTMVIPADESAFRWVYDAQLLDQQQIANMQQQFTLFLEGIAADPDALLGDIPLLPEEERQQLLVHFNDTAADYAQDRCLHELFEAQASRTPHAVALVWQEERVTYRELNRRANQLANYLRTLGVGPDILVGISIERSVEMVVAMLGVLKAGGAYVPLDPAYPQERLRFILDDTQAPVLLTQEHLIERLPDVAHHATVVCLDSDWPLIAQASDENPLSPPHDLGYVIYTSGSTGRPKGVAIEHRSAVTLIDWALDFFRSEGQASNEPGLFKGTLFSTSICFDLSVFELFVPLSCGGKVILAENALELSTSRLPAANEVTLINTVPSAIAALIRAKRHSWFGTKRNIGRGTAQNEPRGANLSAQTDQTGL